VISKPALKIFLGILIAGMFNLPLAAQTDEEETDPPEITGSAADLKISPRVGAGYNSSAAGHDGFGRFEGFVPLFQNPGKDLFFLEGRLLLDNGAHLGGNILLGYRAFNPELNRSFGGYVGYDNRDTGDSTFNQIGVGLESLGEIWDFRLNGYLPVGDTRQLVASNTFDSGFQQAGTPFFQGNSLFLPAERIFQTTNIQEAAMGGVDLEVGAKLAEFGDEGEVRGYGGVYYYDASGSPSTVGGKLRVEVRPTDYLNLGLGVQHDDLFGTNILFTVGGTFPGTRPRGANREQAEPESVWTRMGESVSRTASIVVDQQVDFESFTQQSDLLATNPDTDQPWTFVHVTEGGASDGTFESPFDTLQEGVGVAQSDGNYIVYVRSGDTSGNTGSITVPAQVQLLSAGVLQEINTQELGLVALPFSNSGQLTNFSGTITMEDQSVLSGFNVTSTDGPGIAARDLSFVTIRDSNVVSSSEAALSLENTTGTVNLTNTNLTGNGVPVLVGTNINGLTSTGGSLTSTNSATNGITLDGINGAVEISNSPITITNPQNNGISATNVTGSLTLANGNISNSQANAIFLENSTVAIAISGFEITGAGNSGISGMNLADVTLENNQIMRSHNRGINLQQVEGTLQITNNTITDTTGTPDGSFGQGIELSDVAGTISITDNQITDNFASGIGIVVGDPTGMVPAATTSTADITISGNQIQNNGVNDPNSTAGLGIGIVLGEDAIINSLDISNNTIANNLTDGVFIGLENDAIVNSLDISNNTITNNLTDGIFIAQGALTFILSNLTDGGTSQLNNATISNNTIENNLEQGVDITSFGGTTNVVIEDNLSISQNGQQGIEIFASGTGQITAAINNNIISQNTEQGINLEALLLGEIDADVQLNTLTDNLIGLTGEAGLGRLCVNLNGNNSNTDYLLFNDVGILEIVDLANVDANNTGTVNVVTTPLILPTDVAACP